MKLRFGQIKMDTLQPHICASLPVLMESRCTLSGFYFTEVQRESDEAMTSEAITTGSVGSLFHFFKLGSHDFGKSSSYFQKQLEIQVVNASHYSTDTIFGFISVYFFF